MLDVLGCADLEPAMPGSVRRPARPSRRCDSWPLPGDQDQDRYASGPPASSHDPNIRTAGQVPCPGQCPCTCARPRVESVSEPKVAVPTERHLVRARDLADRAYAEPLEVADLARAAGLSPGALQPAGSARRSWRDPARLPPHPAARARGGAAAQHRSTPVARICAEVGHLQSRQLHLFLHPHLRPLPDRLPRGLPCRTADRVPLARVRGPRARPPAEAQFSRRPGARRSLDSRAC